jgi:proton-dependent oligopeptide transporter, POT family
VSTTVQEGPSAPQRGFFGQPSGLSTLFFTETWERFSYYGMKAILLYYMYDQATAGGLGMDKGMAKALVAVYGSALYMSGILGGWVADRLIGSRNSIFYGGILIMFAHITLAIPGGAPALYTSMVLLVLGTGLLKPNITNAVGGLYSDDDTRRDAGFSIFYMGVNLGAFVAPLVVGTLGQTVNYHLGFSIAAIGMAIGLVQYRLRRRNLGDAGLAPTNPLTGAERSKTLTRLGVGLAVVVAAIVTLAVTGTLSADLVVNVISLLSFLLPLGYFVVMFSSKRVTAVERSRLVAYIPLFIGAVLFWFIEEQQSTVWAQFADQQTNLDALGFHIPSSWAQSVNPLGIIVFAPLLAWLWTRLGTRQPGTPRKFSTGLLLTGASFLIMVLPCVLNGPNGKANPLWLLLSLTVMTVGEVCLSPVGLSATTKLAPEAFVAQTVGLFLAADAAGQGLIAQVSPLYDAQSAPSYFGIIGGIVFVGGMILFVLSPVIQRKMLGVN